MKRAVLLSAVLLASCGKKVPEQQANVPDANPPVQPPAKTLDQPQTDAKQPPAKSKEKPAQPPDQPKVEPTEATLTPGMEAAKKAHEAGNYREAARLYTVELAAEEAKPAQLGAIILPSQSTGISPG